MCHDISYSATSIELATDYLPDLIYDNQISFDFDNAIHVLAQAFKKYPVIVTQDCFPHVKYFEWGLIAPYMNTPEKVKESRASMVNARSEKLLDDNRSIWFRLKNNRCLIPVTGFFEHREIKGWKNKVPYHIKLKNYPFFFLLGIYNYSPNPDVETGEVVGTFSILTRAANELMCKIHNHGANKNRMPVLLDPKRATKWISDDLTETEMRELLDFKIDDSAIDVCPVFTIRTTKPRPDGRGKIDPYLWENLPKLGTDDMQMTLL